MASAVSANRCISSFSLHQNLETFAHASRKDEIFNLYQSRHGCGVTGICELCDLIQDAQTDEVIHLSRKGDCFERSVGPFLDQVGEIDVCRNILLTDSEIGILDRQMMPIAHQRSTRLGVELMAQVAVIDRQMVTAVERCGDSANPMTRLQIDIGNVTLTA